MELMGGGGGGVKVMTDEQMEVLRKQISVYATICDQLVDMHKTLTATQDSLSISGMRMGNLYCDPLMMSGGHKITARQRWNPTPMQLQILESIFDNGNGTPNKQKIKEIATELSQHGQISETNVYNWFQNRRARSKRKQTTPAPSHSGPETDTEVESKQEKTAKPDNLPTARSNSDQAQDTLFNKSTGNFGTLSYYDSILANPRMDQLMGKMEKSSFDFSPLGEGYDIIG